jgi:hypothetical protein
LGRALCDAAQNGHVDVVNAMLGHPCIKEIPHDIEFSLEKDL